MIPIKAGMWIGIKITTKIIPQILIGLFSKRPS